MPAVNTSDKLETVTLRCLIVDDNASFLEEASALLRREGLEVVGTASSIDDALERAHELEPDVALVDISLGEESGFDLARRLAESASHPPRVVLVSTHSETELAELIDDAPVAGFVPKVQLSAGALLALLAAAD
ncbi:MAG: response regulator transcription factor [Actinobacteria bacterium]|nr:response regulator transcription factor [Actinomycetota bacterium]